MSRFTQAKTSEHQAQDYDKGSATEAAPQPGPAGPHAGILGLQRTAGNRAVSDLVTSGKGNTAAGGNGVPPIVQSALTRGGGQPLEPQTRAVMESRFGEDFGEVRVHADEASASAAGRWNARAFMLTNNIYFGAPYDLSSPAGEALLAHELTHIVQAKTAASNPAQLSSPVDALEGEARQVAAAVRDGGPVPAIHGVVRASSVPLLQGEDDLGPPTFGNLPGDTPAPSGLRRVELVKRGETWKEIGYGRTPSTRTAKGSYDFVIQNGRIKAVHSGGSLGHTEAAQGGRVSWAGTIQFSQKGDLKSWDNASGHYLPSGVFAGNAAKAHPNLPMDKFKWTYKGSVVRPTGKREGPQLPVFQPKPPVKAEGLTASPAPETEPSVAKPTTPKAGGVQAESPKSAAPKPTIKSPTGEAPTESAESGAPRRTRPVAGTGGHGGGISGRTVVASMVLHLGAGIALNIFQSWFKDKTKRDLAALPQPKIDQRGAADFLKDPNVKGSMSLLDLFSKNFKPFGQELENNQQMINSLTNLELVGLALMSEKTPAEVEKKLQRLDEIANDLGEYGEVLFMIRDNLDAVLEMEPNCLKTKKAADDLHQFLQNGVVVEWLFNQGFSVEEISQMDSNLLHLSVSIDIAFRDAHGLQAKVDKVIEDELKVAKSINQSWWLTFSTHLQAQMKERQQQQEKGAASQPVQPQKPEAPKVQPEPAKQPPITGVCPGGCHKPVGEKSLTERLGKLNFGPEDEKKAREWILQPNK